MKKALLAIVGGSVFLPACGGGTAPSGTQGELASSPEVTPSGSPEEPCARCHPTHVAEWQISSHAYAMSDPVFHSMVRLGQAETEGRIDQFCTNCHSPIGVRTGQTEVYFDEELGVYQQRTEGLDPDAMAGVSCDVCHFISKVEERFNAGFVLADDGVRRATVRDPVPSGAHESAYSALHQDSDLCGSCHQVVNDFGVGLERTMLEWVQSSFPGRKSCQDCHMPEYQGEAATGGPERDVHRHFMVGVDVSLLPPEAFPGYDRYRELARELLKESAELAVVPVPEEKALIVTIENLAGHALPSGATADREMWIELVVRDAAGTIVLESGTLDERGDLRVDNASHTTEPGTDPQLVLYTQKMYWDPKLVDPSSTEPRRQVEFLWEPNAEESFLVGAGGSDERRFDLGALDPGDYSVSVRLLFRSFPPHLLRLLERKGGLDPAVKERVPTVEMEAASVELTLP